MTYSVAVIQNETELLRYSYADIRRTTPGFNYLWSYYTAENIDSLHHDLGTFDALILATNSCNDVKIRTWLDRNADRIKCLVEDKVLGLMVLFQMALSDERSTGPYTFLPDLWEATSIKRVQPNAPGDLQRGPHAHCSQVLRFPNTVDIRDLETACLHNSNVPGLRWGYLSRFSPSLYTVLLYEQAEDDDVPLLLSSEGSDQPRIVLSTLVLDWQKHDALLENCLRYVVEGESPCLVVKCRGRDSFEIDVLENTLRERRIPWKSIALTTLRDLQIERNLYSTVLFDPAWDDNEVASVANNLVTERRNESLAFQYFTRTSSTELVACRVLTHNRYHDMAASGSAWLRSRWRGQLWDASFWSTVDVLQLLNEMGDDVSLYGPQILPEIRRHIQPDGSYDEVFGATCAAALAFSLLGNAEADLTRALNWILDSIDHQNLYNKATAVELLERIGPTAISEQQKAAIAHAITASRDNWSPGLETLRYMRTLLELGEHEQAHNEVHRLVSATRGDSEWLTLFGAAEAVVIMLDIYSRVDSPSLVLKRLLFSGLGYIARQFDADTGSWRENVAATAKSGRAMHRYSELVPSGLADAIDHVSIRPGTTVSYSALRRFRGTNADLVENQTQLRRRIGELESSVTIQEPQLRGTRKLILAAIPVLYVLLLVSAIEALYITATIEPIWKFMSDWQSVSIPAALVLVMAPVYFTACLARTYDLLPRWWNQAIARFPVLKKLLGGEA